MSKKKIELLLKQQRIICADHCFDKDQPEYESVVNCPSPLEIDQYKIYKHLEVALKEVGKINKSRIIPKKLFNIGWLKSNPN